jgi:hypothetical protein
MNPLLWKIDGHKVLAELQVANAAQGSADLNLSGWPDISKIPTKDNPMVVGQNRTNNDGPPTAHLFSRAKLVPLLQ